MSSNVWRRAGPSRHAMDTKQRRAGTSSSSSLHSPKRRRAAATADEQIEYQHLESRDPVTVGTVVQLERTLDYGQLTYTAPITIEGQDLNVQIDTGTGDFWLASDRCGTSSCKGKEGFTVQLFRDDTGLDVGQSIHVTNFIGGRAEGPIVVSNLSFASTTIDGQALLTAIDVENYELGEMQATGVIGLSPPLGSMIQSVLGTNSSGQNNSMTDTTRTGSVLPGLMDTLPEGSRYYGLGLQRLPSDGGNGNSTLTFGGIDANYVPTSEHKNIHYTAVSADSDGAILTWNLIVNNFLLNINDSTVQIPLAQTGALVVSAILDSGSPLNFASANFLNAVYGAYNVGPAADGTGEYYIDCATEILMTINVGGVDIPIHPLDASLKYSNIAGSSNSACIGSFQAFPEGTDADTVGAELILGAPFLRSVYSIYSCEPHPASNNVTGWCSTPTVGLYPLYNTSGSSWQTAINDFNKVRRQGQTLGDNSIIVGSTTKSSGGGFGASAKIAVGVVCGLFGMAILMVLLLFVLRRRRRKMNFDAMAAVDDSADDVNEKDAIHGNIDWKKLSENERIKARELAMLHGRFVEEPDDGRNSPMAPTHAPDDWDTTSKGYWEARAIVNEYRKRELERERQSSMAAKSLSGSAGSTTAAHMSMEEPEGTSAGGGGGGHKSSELFELQEAAAPALPSKAPSYHE